MRSSRYRTEDEDNDDVSEDEFLETKKKKVPQKALPSATIDLKRQILEGRNHQVNQFDESFDEDDDDDDSDVDD